MIGVIICGAYTAALRPLEFPKVTTMTRGTVGVGLGRALIGSSPQGAGALAGLWIERPTKSVSEMAVGVSSSLVSFVLMLPRLAEAGAGILVELE